MSNRIIEKLLNGAEVEWKSLGEIADIEKGKQLNKSLLSDDGEYPVINGGIKPSGYWHEYNNEANNIVISQGGASAGFVNWLDTPFFAGAHAFVVIPNEDILIKRFVYHYLKMNQNKFMEKQYGAGIPALAKSDLANLLFPIPNLEIQKKIVKTLDKFTELEATLEATLEAELALRKKQYQYYRETLLTFPQDLDRGGYNEITKAIGQVVGKNTHPTVVWKSLGEVAEYSKTRIKFDCLDETNYVGVDNLLQNKMGKINSSYVPTSGNLIEYRENDILIGNIRPYLKKIWQANSNGGTNGDVLVIRTTDNQVNPRYLYQVLADDKFFSYNMQHAKGAKMPRGNKAAILQYLLPIPSLAEQEYIVEVLDKFDNLTNSITEGLPKEIELRRKQYEYYREKLLDFPRNS